MILYQLQCDHDHRFEAWFRDSSAYDHLAEAGELSCPVCGSRAVSKALMAPRLARRRGDDAPPPPEAPAASAPAPVSGPFPPAARVAASTFPPGEQGAELAEKLGDMLKKVRTLVETHCDNVGDRFAEEARRIHYGETEPRGIYGQTTPEEAQDLAEEGVEFTAVPWLRHDA